jgi:surface polysaccharide O-acyltransferase-like enzyme
MNANDMMEREMFSNNNYLRKDDKNNYQTIKRNYGIDLLRIFSMINIINLHLNLNSGQLSLKSTSSKFYNIWRLEVFSYWAVDCFGLISGIVGYKRYKFSNLIYLWIQVCFYSTSISLILFIRNQINIKELFLSLFPILIKRHWYVNAYFSMYLLLPFVNYGINSLNRNLYRNIIIFFIFFFSIYNIIAVIFGNNNYHFLFNGYSSMWLTILYIIGAFFGKYIIIDKSTIGVIHFIVHILIYIFCSFLSSEIKFKLIKIKSKIPDTIIINYLSPTILLQSISLIMGFSRINIKNKYIIKIILFLTPLNFSVMLIHGRLFRTKIRIIKSLFKLINEFKSNKIFFKVYGLSIIIYFFCIFLDYFRLIIFTFLKIREFCLLLEKKFPDCLVN